MISAPERSACRRAVKRRCALRGKVVPRANGNQPFGRERGAFLVVAEDCAFARRLFRAQESKNPVLVPVKQNHRRVGRVVAVFHPGGERALVGGKLVGHRVGNRHAVADHAERVVSNSAGAQESQAVTVDFDDGGLQSDFAFSAVKDHIHASVHVMRDICGAGRGGLPREVCGRRGDRKAAQCDQAVCNGV